VGPFPQAWFGVGEGRLRPGKAASPELGNFVLASGARFALGLRAADLDQLEPERFDAGEHPV
jgi:hypothetical protein